MIIPPLRLIAVFSQPFGNILSLVPLAESVVKLSAVCMQCYMEAAYTKRTGNEKEVRRQSGLAKNWNKLFQRNGLSISDKDMM